MEDMNEYNNRKGLITTPIHGRGDDIEQEMSLIAEEELSQEQIDWLSWEAWKKEVEAQQEYSIEWYNNINR